MTRQPLYVEEATAVRCTICNTPFEKGRTGMARVSHANRHVREGRAVAEYQASRWGGRRPRSVTFYRVDQ